MPLKKHNKDALVIIGLGSNQGELIHNLDEACKAIEKEAGEIIKMSEVYKTAPWGRTDQDHFVNMVISIQCSLSPWGLLRVLQSIEKRMNEELKENWGPRTIDLDIIYFDQKIIIEKELIIPHPYMYFRNFVLVPLLEIAPDMIHPIRELSTAELLENCDDTSSVSRMGHLQQLIQKQ